LPDRVAFWVTEQSALGASRPSPLEPPTAALIEQASVAGLDGLDINDLPERPRGEIALIRQADLQTCVWTVNSVERAVWLRDEGMQSITTDVTSTLRAALSSL